MESFPSHQTPSCLLAGPWIYTGLFQTCLSTGAITCPFSPLFQRAFFPGQGIPDEPPDILPVVQVPSRERRLLETMQLAIGEFITDLSQGLPPSPRVWGRKGPKPQFSRVFIRSKKAAGSWRKRIGYTVARQFLLARCGAFSLPLIGSLFLARHMLIG